MSSFTSPLKIEPVDDNMTKWKLLEPFEFYIDEEGRRIYYKVPAGFITDFASVPKIFWNILPPWGKYGKAAVLHDYLYRTKLVSRKKADEIFLLSMKVLKVSFCKRYLMYLAVRIFGKKAWEGG